MTLMDIRSARSVAKKGSTRKGASTADGERFNEFTDMIDTLNKGSVNRSFDAYGDIDWDAPEMAVVDNDERWILPDADPIGKHPWYLAQSKERQIEIGMWRQANVAKVGLEFESILIRGMLQYAMQLPNGAPEFRYGLHESKEECNHIMMFQELVNRMGVDVPGGPRWFKLVSPLIPLAATPLPLTFFTGILAGEEPIDHLQKSILRHADDLHPMFANVMAVHVAEEARHISYAHEFIKYHLKEMGKFKKLVSSLMFPVVMRVLCDVIVKPPKSFSKEFDVPKSVMNEIFWDSEEGRALLTEVFSDVRMLANDSGLMNPVSRRLWKALKIDGKASRYRSQPQEEMAA
jgi:hypothetical protein